MANENIVDVEIASILNSTKKKLGIAADYDAFDHDIIVSINTAFATLFDEGLKYKDDPIRITGEDDLWEDYITDPLVAGLIEDYVYIYVKLLFDPPNNSFLLENYKTKLAELEWRIYTQVNDYLPEVHTV